MNSVYQRQLKVSASAYFLLSFVSAEQVDAAPKPVMRLLQLLKYYLVSLTGLFYNLRMRAATTALPATKVFI